MKRRAVKVSTHHGSLVNLLRAASAATPGAVIPRANPLPTRSYDSYLASLAFHGEYESEPDGKRSDWSESTDQDKEERELSIKFQFSISGEEKAQSWRKNDKEEEESKMAA